MKSNQLYRRSGQVSPSHSAHSRLHGSLLGVLDSPPKALAFLGLLLVQVLIIHLGPKTGLNNRGGRRPIKGGNRRKQQRLRREPPKEVPL